MRHPTRIALAGSLLVALATATIAMGIDPSRRRGPETVPTERWATSSPESKGIDAAALSNALLAIRHQGIPIHSLLIERHGNVVLDGAFAPYDGRSPHDLASVTKSVTATLIGIAAGRGLVSLDSRADAYLPAAFTAARDGRRGEITVRDLLTMRSGLRCDASNDQQLVDRMEGSPDWGASIAAIPMASEPGSTFAYCSANFHLLSMILERVTGRSEADFAHEVLFGPLGISHVVWPADPQGHTRGWGDLHLVPDDLARIGLLWQRGGLWGTRQVVPAGFVAEALQPKATTPGDDYGEGWWIPRNSATDEVAAIGRDGQRLAIHRTLDLVVVITGQGVDPDAVGKLLAPALVRPDGALPQNTAADDTLQHTLQSIAVQSTGASRPLPRTAATISGRRWLVDPNPTRLSSVALSFGRDGSGQIAARFGGGVPAINAPIGLDGRDRTSLDGDGLLVGFRGFWSDASTFALTYDQISDHASHLLTFRFADRGITITISTPGSGDTTLTGRVDDRDIGDRARGVG